MNENVECRCDTEELGRNSNEHQDTLPHGTIGNSENGDNMAQVYICSPLSGDTTGNQEKARKYCRHAVGIKVIPVAPHLFFPQFMDDGVPEERELAMSMNLALLRNCAELWVFGSTVSKGMSVEIAEAEKRRMPIRFFTEDLKEVHKS